MESRPNTLRKGNGRLPVENHLYAELAAGGHTPEQRAQRVADMNEGRRHKAEERVLADEPGLSGDALERAVREDIRLQMIRIRARALTARRKATEAEARATVAESELAEAIAADSGDSAA